ncbi:hypothetical protein B0H10DRAFT_2035776, partial [Mycena sp. CBHHK59/15]
MSLAIRHSRGSATLVPLSLFPPNVNAHFQGRSKSHSESRDVAKEINGLTPCMRLCLGPCTPTCTPTRTPIPARCLDRRARRTRGRTGRATASKGKVRSACMHEHRTAWRDGKQGREGREGGSKPTPIRILPRIEARGIVGTSIPL